VNEGEVVLDIIHRLQQTQAGDLAVAVELQGRQVRLVQREVNGRPRLMCMTRMNTFTEDEVVTVTRCGRFPVVRDLVTDVEFNYTKAREIPAFAPPVGVALGESDPQVDAGAGIARTPRRRREGRDLPRLRVVELDVGDQVADHREGPQRGHRDDLVLGEGVHPVMHISRGRPLTLGAARAALAGLAVPPHREIAGLGLLQPGMMSRTTSPRSRRPGSRPGHPSPSRRANPEVRRVGRHAEPPFPASPWIAESSRCILLQLVELEQIQQLAGAWRSGSWRRRCHVVAHRWRTAASSTWRHRSPSPEVVAGVARPRLSVRSNAAFATQSRHEQHVSAGPARGASRG